MLKTWAKALSAPTAGGKTNGTFDDVGTIQIPNKKDPVYLYGLLVLAVGQAVVAGESGIPYLQIDSEDLGINKAKFVLEKLGFTDPIATNTQMVAVPSQFVPVRYDGPVNNAKLDIAISGGTTMTNDWEIEVSAIFGNVPIDQLSSVDPAYLDELVDNFTAKVRGQGKLEDDPAKSFGTANEDQTLTAVEIKSVAKELIALFGMVLPNAPTPGEEIVSRFSYKSGDIEGFEPQEYPACVGFNPTLGTVVGGAQGTDKARYYPIRFPLPGSAFDLQVQARNAVALTNAPNTIQAIKYR